MAECRITKLTEENLEAVVALGKQFAEETPVYERLEFDEDGTREFFKKFYQPVPGHADMAFIAMLEEHCVAFLMVSLYKHPCLKGAIASDELMYVHPDARGMGIGSVLVEEYKEWASFLGADLVLLGSSSGINSDFAQKFYEKHAFEPCGVLTRWKYDVRREQ